MKRQINMLGTRPNKNDGFLSDEEALPRLEMIRSYVTRPIPDSADWTDPEPALVENTSVLIGNKYHASNVKSLVERGVTAVLNCASGGISRLPIDELQEKGICYEFTNVRMDDYAYPILFDHETGEPSVHLQVAKAVYARVCQEGGRVLFFCVAGQNRSATLALAVLLLFGHSLEVALKSLSLSRSFVLENQGFQRQLVELEAMLRGRQSKRIKLNDQLEVYAYANPPRAGSLERRTTASDAMLGLVEVELLIPGLCTVDVKIPKESTIAEVKERLKAYADEFLLKHYSKDVSTDSPARVAKSWMVLAMFGFDDMYDFPLETEVIDLGVQLRLMQEMFDLEVFMPDGSAEQHVRWNSRCRFALVIFSVFKSSPAGELGEEKPWTFLHEERPAAPATFLDNNLLTTHLRGWDFIDGSPLSSMQPIVFSFSPDPRDKRQFMRISTRTNKPVQFHAPGEGGILGMGANAIVHRVELGKVTRSINSREEGFLDTCPKTDRFDAAVKRHFSFNKMVAFLENRSEAGLAKRMRLANSLNSDGRVVEFYGLGLGLSSNSYNEHEFKFEAVLLARYEEEFSTYTMKKFIDDYLIPVEIADSDEALAIEKLQSSFSLISVKVLLVSLLNAFRDLTLMGVQAFDFNHLNNVLVSRDHRLCRLIDIDGDSKGSIQLDESCEYIHGSPSNRRSDAISLHKPSLEIDLSTVLPTLIDHLILGKGRGRGFVTNKRSEIWKATPDVGKEMIMEVLLENFYPSIQGADDTFKARKHVHKVSLWYYALLKRQPPWGNWTRDIYDAMRCIDHLPIA